MTSNMNYHDDEIDIRELLRTLIRYKWYILGITLLVMVLVFVLLNFVLPKKYAAQAQVIVTEPLYTTNLESQIFGTPQTPEAGILKDMAQAEDLLWRVYTSPDVSAVLSQVGNFEGFKTLLSAKLVGTSVVFLEVSSSEAETSATIVNRWAEQVSDQINLLYSVNEYALDLVVKEVENARLKWDTAQQTLIEKLPDGVVETRKIELLSKQHALEINLAYLTELDLLKSDTKSLQQRLGVWPDNSPVSIEVQMSLIGLYQRAAGGLEGVQLVLAEPITERVRTVAEVKASLDALIQSIDSQSHEIQANLDSLQQEITAARQALEAAEYLNTQLSTERDLAKNAYQALSAQVEEIRIDLARNDLVAKVASHALPPQKPVSRRTLVTTLIAGILAFIVTCFAVLIINWWNSSASNEKPK